MTPPLPDAGEISADEPSLDAPARPFRGGAGRSQLLERVQESLDALSDGRTLMVMALRLDNFNELAVALGVAVGEFILEEVTKRLMGRMADSNALVWAVRDEFILCGELPDTPGDAHAFQVRVESCFHEPFHAAKSAVYVSACVGVSFSTGSRDDAVALVGSAEVACADGVRQGRNRFVVYDRPARLRIRTDFEMEQGLQAALSRQELGVLYDPILEATTGRALGLAAQFTWTPSGQAPVSREVLLRHATRSGLMSEVGSWMLRELAQKWPPGRLHPSHPLRLFVQVTSDQLGAWFASAPDDLAAAARAAGGRLSLEVLDTRFTHDVQTSSAILAWLKDLGIELIVDLFGHDYAALSSVRTLSVDALKINASLVAGLPSNERDVLMVGKLVELAHALGTRVIAGGVASTEQLEVLTELGCDYVHAQYLAPPLPLTDALAILTMQTGARPDG